MGEKVKATEPVEQQEDELRLRVVCLSTGPCEGNASKEFLTKLSKAEGVHPLTLYTMPAGVHADAEQNRVLNLLYNDIKRPCDWTVKQIYNPRKFVSNNEFEETCDTTVDSLTVTKHAIEVTKHAV